MVDIPLQDRVHPGLIASPLRPEPPQHVGVYAQGHLLLWLWKPRCDGVFPPFIGFGRIRISPTAAHCLVMAHTVTGPAFTGGTLSRQLFSRIAYGIL